MARKTFGYDELIDAWEAFGYETAEEIRVLQSAKFTDNDYMIEWLTAQLHVVAMNISRYCEFAEEENRLFNEGERALRIARWIGTRATNGETRYE